MRVVSLASGSSGNATLIEAGTTSLLLDAGLNLRTMTARLREVGSDPARLSAIVLTHEHSDHTNGALLLAQQYDIPLMADARTLAAVMTTVAPVDDLRAVIQQPHPVGSTWGVGTLTLTSFAVPHDAVAPCGYLIGTAAWHICLVTDCGEITSTILSHMQRAQVIIIEANHDRTLLVRGPYPQHLKKRILSPQGHLANDQAADALFACLDDSPRWVWLAHLSKTNNTPLLAEATVTKRLGERRLRSAKVAITRPGLGPTWDSATLLSPLSRM